MNTISTQLQDTASQSLASAMSQDDTARASQADQPVQTAPVSSATPTSTASQDAQPVPDETQGKNQLTRQDAEKLVGKVQEYFGGKGVSLNFKVLAGSDGVQVQVLDAKSGKVLRKIPDDELVKLGDSLKREAKGVMDKAV
jgi:flagellar protein FlaG